MKVTLGRDEEEGGIASHVGDKRFSSPHLPPIGEYSYLHSPLGWGMTPLLLTETLRQEVLAFI